MPTVEEIEHIRIHGPITSREPLTCNRCNYDNHYCPGCGEWLYHGTNVCGNCIREMNEQTHW